MVTVFTYVICFAPPPALVVCAAAPLSSAVCLFQLILVGGALKVPSRLLAAALRSKKTKLAARKILNMSKKCLEPRG